MNYKADFHNHSCLSPCAGIEMGPITLVNRAKNLGIKILGLTDHNSARNTPAFEYLAKESGILPLCGVEVTTSEEIHVLCFFPTSGEALDFGNLIEKALPRIPLNHEKMGEQWVVNKDEEILEEVDFYLGTATSYGIDQVEKLCHDLGGLFIPAHIDRPTSSLKSQLGYIPQLNYDGFEIQLSPEGLNTGITPLVKGSDAHHPDMVGQRTCEIDLPQLSWEALVAYFQSFSRV